MKYIVGGEEMARIEKYSIEEIGIPQMVFMERAALEVFKFIENGFLKTAHILVAVDSGNNGGDGIALARLLYQAGYNVEVYWIDALEKKSEAFISQYKIAKNINIKFIDEIVNYGYDIIVDAIFGVGLNRAISGKHADAINLLNEMDGYKLAVDIPSGIDSETGFVLGTAFRADATITFGFMKLGMLMGLGNEYSGKVTVADIGFPKKAVDFIEPRHYGYEESDIEKLLPYRKSDSHKGSYGRVAVIGGCKNIAGASIFSAESAYRIGCGLVKVCTVEDNRQILQTRLPEAMLSTCDPCDKDSIRKAIKDTIAWADVVILGPGLGTFAYAEYIVNKILSEYEKKLIIDADGLNIISNHLEWLDETKADVIITPHLVEMSRLTGLKTAAIKEAKYDVAKKFAKEHNVIVVLKDSRTIVSDGHAQAYINSTGNNGMATGGSGDVLTGVIGGLCAQKMNIFEAAKLGVYIHGLAGQEAAIKHGRYSMIAGDIVKSITRVLEGDYYGI